eukprot:386111-Alexandrium_andersonii.AAC.1
MELSVQLEPRNGVRRSRLQEGSPPKGLETTYFPKGRLRIGAGRNAACTVGALPCKDPGGH